jgi:hypothetical protein
MNCEHHIKFPETEQDLICTAYPPKTPGEQPVNKSNSPAKSGWAGAAARELFTRKSRWLWRCEQVP